jgi:hypothetical protein
MFEVLKKFIRDYMAANGHATHAEFLALPGPVRQNLLADCSTGSLSSA